MRLTNHLNKLKQEVLDNRHFVYNQSSSLIAQPLQTKLNLVQKVLRSKRAVAEARSYLRNAEQVDFTSGDDMEESSYSFSGDDTKEIDNTYGVDTEEVDNSAGDDMEESFFRFQLAQP